MYSSRDSDRGKPIGVGEICCKIEAPQRPPTEDQPKTVTLRVCPSVSRSSQVHKEETEGGTTLV